MKEQEGILYLFALLHLSVNLSSDTVQTLPTLLFSTEAINGLQITEFVADVESNNGGVSTRSLTPAQVETNLGVSEFTLSTKSLIGLNTLHQVTFYAIINNAKVQICRVENAV